MLPGIRDMRDVASYLLLGLLVHWRFPLRFYSGDSFNKNSISKFKTSILGLQYHVYTCVKNCIMLNKKTFLIRTFFIRTARLKIISVVLLYTRVYQRSLWFRGSVQTTCCVARGIFNFINRTNFLRFFPCVIWK